LSDHPDPILVTQYPAELATLHQIVQIIRNGNLPIPEPRAFTTIIFAGHSYGSCLGNALNAQYPDDVDATILTGFSSAFDANVPGILLETALLPADIDNPTSFGTLSPGYLEIATQSSDQLLLFYPGGYDPNLFNLDYSLRGTIAAGELGTIIFTKSVATPYTKPVFVMTGEFDTIFCNPLGLPDPGNCQPSGLLGLGSTNYLADTSSLYPAADFDWYVVPGSGHCWNFHFAAPEGFATAHNWMAAKGF
jgi:pimeloyl-ACP methyl ester carboxylesterase